MVSFPWLNTFFPNVITHSSKSIEYLYPGHFYIILYIREYFQPASWWYIFTAFSRNGLNFTKRAIDACKCILHKVYGIAKKEYWAAYTWLQKYCHPFLLNSVLQGCQCFCIPVYLLPPTLELCITQKASYQTKFIRMNQNLLLISSILAKRKLPQY